MFSFELEQGDPQTALTRPFTVVLTPDLAQRQFGDTDPIGRSIRLEERYDYEVTGIVLPPPGSCHVQFTALASFVTQYELQRYMLVDSPAGGWHMWAFPTYLLLAEGTGSEDMGSRISEAIAGVTDQTRYGERVYALQPLTEVYLDTSAPNQLGPRSDPRYAVLCATVAALILVIAAVNYVNLATARAGRRAREIGVRKSLGAYRGQLMRQLVGESVLLCAVATALAVALAEAAIPLFPQLAGIEIPSLEWTPGLWAAAVGLATALGVAAGVYPAWIVSRFQPAATARRGDAIGGAGLRKGLVVLQFTVTAALMTVTLVVWQQLDYIQDRRLGLEPEQVVVIDNRALEPPQAQTFKQELLRDSRVAAVSLAQRVPAGNMASMTVRPEGFDELVRMTSYGVDEDFVEAMGMRMALGRNLTSELATDAEAILINETAARELGWREPLGKVITFNGTDRQVVGVVADFHYESLHKPVQPLYMAPIDGPGIGRWAGCIAVRVRSDRLDGVLEMMDSKWSSMAPPTRYAGAS